MTQAPILRLANVEAAYGPITAIRGISLDVPRGKIVAVLGANGAGKTTILKTASGVLDPVMGVVELEGRKIQGMAPDRIVGFGMSHVPEGREVFPFLSVRDNLRMGAYLRTDRAGVAADLDKVYDYFPVLRERRDQPAGLLSGGQQQMLAISRALMSRPKLLLLDEPSLGLSPLLVKEIFTIVRRLNREEGVSILLVEQNAKVALETADYGYVLEVGRIVMHDSSDALMQSNEIRESYLGVHADDVRAKTRRDRRRVAV
ncbi:MAG: ABC transporter ATP-binding protein [Hyphomicrobiales bacterium]|nr:ABC transporter ATP-binding protein [Hyphomicrobiales bacterium]